MILIYSTQIYSEQELINLTLKIISLIPKKSTILLSGGLSAGKTTLVSSFCRNFDLQLSQSPTYSIHQRYANRNVVVDHFDLYRLDSAEDVESSGFFDLMAEAADYKFIEWPERVKTSDFAMDRALFKLIINMTSDDSRLIEIYKLN